MFKKLFKSEFSNSVLKLLTGTSIAQLIPLLAAPIISRIFTPEEFGLFAFYSSIVIFLSVFATGRYELSIQLPKEHKDAFNLLVLCFLILIGFSFLVALILFIWGTEIFKNFQKDTLNDWIYLVPVFIFLTGSLNILSMWLHRKKMFAKTAISKVQQNLFENLIIIFLGARKSNINVSDFLDRHKPILNSKIDIDISSLISGKLIGLVITNLYLAFNFFKDWKFLKNDFNISTLKKQGYLHRKFPQINMLHAASDELKTSGLSFIILYYFSDYTLGIYNQTYRLLRAPLGIIGTSFGHVFFQKAAELYANNIAIDNLVKKTVKTLFLIGLPVFTFIFFLSPWFFEFLLGNEWKEVGVYAQYITPWLFANFVISPVSQVALISNKHFEFWIINLVGSLLVFFSIMISGLFFEDIKTGFIMISISQVIFYFWVYNWTLKISKK